MEGCVTLLVVGTFLQILSSGFASKRVNRPLQKGDILTPKDFLEIAKKLRGKVGYPGEGNGIVSSSKSPETLADRLFQTYFFTNNRFVFLKDEDFDGLDALQALALSGIGFNPKIHFLKAPLRRNQLLRRCQYMLMSRKLNDKNDKVESGDKDTSKDEPGNRKAIPEAKHLLKHRLVKVKLGRRHENDENPNTEPALPNSTRQEKADIRRAIPEAKKLLKKRLVKVKMGRREGDTEDVTNKEKQLLSKNESNEDEERRAIPQAKLLLKNRHLKVKMGRKQGNETIASYAETPSYRKEISSQLEESVDPDKARSHAKEVPDNCIWKYTCKIPEVMTSCVLERICPKDDRSSTYDDIAIDHKEDEHGDSIQQVRKLIGIYLIDEEVEKIFERRILNLEPIQKKRGTVKSGKVDGMKVYFDEVIRAQVSRTTPAYKPMDNIKERNKLKYMAAKKAMYDHWVTAAHESYDHNGFGNKNKRKDKNKKYLAHVKQTTPLTSVTEFQGRNAKVIRPKVTVPPQFV